MVTTTMMMMIMTIKLVTTDPSPATPRIPKHCPGDSYIDCVDPSFIDIAQLQYLSPSFQQFDLSIETAHAKHFYFYLS
jgi:hypothetical protein